MYWMMYWMRVNSCGWNNQRKAKKDISKATTTTSLCSITAWKKRHLHTPGSWVNYIPHSFSEHPLKPRPSGINRGKEVCRKCGARVCVCMLQYVFEHSLACMTTGIGFVFCVHVHRWVCMFVLYTPEFKVITVRLCVCPLPLQLLVCGSGASSPGERPNSGHPGRREESRTLEAGQEREGEDGAA